MSVGRHDTVSACLHRVVREVALLLMSLDRREGGEPGKKSARLPPREAALSGPARRLFMVGLLQMKREEGWYISVVPTETMQTELPLAVGKGWSRPLMQT